MSLILFVFAQFQCLIIFLKLRNPLRVLEYLKQGLSYLEFFLKEKKSLQLNLQNFVGCIYSDHRRGELNQICAGSNCFSPNINLKSLKIFCGLSTHGRTAHKAPKLGTKTKIAHGSIPV